jgi:hypothetical protein
MAKGRTRLLLDHPWFGALSMRLGFEQRWDITTMATDGTGLYYNPEFVIGLSSEHVVSIIAHEVMHCALLHPYRRGNREPELWNVVCGGYATKSEQASPASPASPGARQGPGAIYWGSVGRATGAGECPRAAIISDDSR